MLPSPTSSPHRNALCNSTNIRQVPCPLPTPPEYAKAKRPRSSDFDTVEPVKRPKFSTKDDKDEGGSDSDSDADALRVVRRRRTTVFDAMSANASRPGPRSRLMRPSTQTVIQNLVSSHETDRYICHGSRSFLTPPYSCAYSNAAKNGGVAHLAVATEQGSVYIWDTASQNGRGEHRPQRIDLNIHNNGIFDVSWSASDDLLATASGDNTVRITDPITGKILYNLDGHTTTVKAVVWNPSNPSLLSTGGRDGCICLWDLRSSERHLRRDDDIDFMGPETMIKGAHDDASQTPARGRGKKTKLGSGRAITSVVYSPNDPHGLISSGSFDGILRYWDLRFPGRKSKTILPHHVSSMDPTTLHGARRARGITSLVAGSGLTSGLLFGLGIDSRIHTYATPTLNPLPADTNCFTHPDMMTNSFYSRLSVSPDGRWLASGSTKTTVGGSAFAFDVAHAGRVNPGPVSTQGVRLTAHSGEVCAVDWANDSLATCADDGSVRIWRNDPEVRWRCEADCNQAADWAWGVVNGP